MDETIDLKRILVTMKQKKWWLIGSVVSAIILMFIYLQFIVTPIYQSSTQLLVSQADQESQLQAQDIQANLELINTYSAILTSPRILDEVKKELKDRYSEERLSQAIHVNNATNSQIIELVVEDKSPKATVEIANTTATVFKKQILEIMKLDNITVISPAKEVKNQTPIKPQKTIMYLLAVIVGLFIGLIIIFFQVVLDRSIKGPEGVQDILGISLLGTISEMKENE